MKIDSYSFGRIAVDGQSYTSDVIISPECVKDAWWRKQGHSLHVDDLEEILAAKPEVLIVGSGYYGRMQIPPATRRFLEQHGIELRDRRTADAVEEFNRLQQEFARVIAALHLTC
jgi:hypothetical protein